MSILEDMVAGFLECAAWADFEANGISDDAQFADSASATARAACERFLANANGDDVQEYLAVYSASRMGNRVYLDSVGHGTGFWDETGLPDGLGDRLSKVCGNAEFHMWQNDAALVEMEG
jgi:hypothetical protein